MSSKETLAHRLSLYVCGMDYRRLPPEVIDRLKGQLLDQLGCQLIGSTVPWNQSVYQFVRENKYGGPATIVNHGDKVPIDDAALVNGTFGQGCELDDYYDQGGGHPGAATVPVAMALAEKSRIDGRNFLTAMAAGYEIGWRLGKGLLPEMMRRGYHAQGVVGVFIAAATAGKLLGLDPEKLTHALAIAGSHASGTMEYDQSGGEVKRMHNGMACSGGLRSALTADKGLTGPPTIFEGERGILKVFSGESRTGVITRAMGTDYAVLHAAIKRFPVNASQHSPIELLDKLIKENSIRPEDVKKITVGVNEGVILHSGSIYEPHEVIEAQFSLRFSLALRLLRGGNELKSYLDRNAWHDPAILALERKIDLYADPTAVKERRFACRMKITLLSGVVIDGTLQSPKGNFSNSLSKEELTEKFLANGSSVLPQEKLERIVEKVGKVEAEEDMASLAALLSAQ
ncbi:MAG TPA: MmgE/PrpD family protein [Candidatus Binatia bacterium]